MIVVADASPLIFLLRAMQQRLLSPHDAHTVLDRLVESHGFRIGIGVYQAAIGAISRAQ